METTTKKCQCKNHYSPEKIEKKSGTFEHICPECKEKNKYTIKLKNEKSITKNHWFGMTLTHTNKESFFLF